jgi:hypothetical protein
MLKTLCCCGYTATHVVKTLLLCLFCYIFSVCLPLWEPGGCKKGAGPRGFEPLVFGFLPPLRPEADALIRAGLRAPFLKQNVLSDFKLIAVLFLNQFFVYPPSLFLSRLLSRVILYYGFAQLLLRVSLNFPQPVQHQPPVGLPVLC